MDSENQENDKDELYFTIGEVAKEIGVVPKTIRNWEIHGLFTATRSESGYRLYSVQDIEKLREIKRYSKEKHMGVNGIRLLYSSDTGQSKLFEKNSVVLKSKLGGKWKDIRVEHGYFLADVAREIDISPSYLSKIENGRANASYEIIEKLNKYYDININDHIEVLDVNLSRIVKKDRGEKTTFGKGVTVESLVNNDNFTLTPMLYTVEPGGGRLNYATHQGEEFLHVLKGKIEVILDDKTYVLSVGDSLIYKSTESHSWRNIKKSKAEILWVYTQLVK